MSMDQAPENNLPTGLRLSADAGREIVALRRQLAEAEDHNSELLGVLAAVRQAATDGQQEAKTRYAQTGNPDWIVRGQVHAAYGEIVKPVV